MFYGYRWLNSYGASDDGTWLTSLHDLTPEQILNGINAVRLSGKEWPPTLPEFRRMCLPPKLPPYLDGGAAVSENRRLRLAQPIDWDKQRARLAEVKAILNRQP